MAAKKWYVVEWKIENFSHWCEEVHGKCMQSLRFQIKYCDYLELYPKGVSGQDDHLVVRISGLLTIFSGDISYLCSDETLLCHQQVCVKNNNGYLELPAGPKLEDVLSRIRECDGALTVRFRSKDRRSLRQHMITTINILKLSLKLNLKVFEKISKFVSACLVFVHLSSNLKSEGLMLTYRSKNKMREFSIEPIGTLEYPISVEMVMRCEKLNLIAEHVFRENIPWEFPHFLEKKDIVEKEISVLLDLTIKTRCLPPNYNYTNYNSDCVIIDFSNNNSPTEDGSSVDSDISKQDENSVSTLTTDLMCLYQDQKFSDLELRSGDITFPVHRNILSARSPVFETMLSCDMKESSSGRVDITDLDPSTLGLFITFLYTGAVGEEGLHGENALNLYYAADKYQVPSLKKECADFLSASVFISNVCDILALANKHQDVELTSVARDFILKNYNDVLKSKEWKNFMSCQPVLAVETLTSFAVEDKLKI